MVEISIDAKGRVEKIKNILILGAGTMGLGIARLFVTTGYNVRVVDPFEKNLKKTAAVTGLSNDKLFSSFTKGSVNEVDLIIEAVTENPKLKKEQVYEVIANYHKGGYLQEGLLIGSNTSSIPIKELGQSLPDVIRPNFIGTHFFNPAHYMKLLEIIRGDKTSDKTYECIYYLAKEKLFKEVSTAADLPGFIVNRLLIIDYGQVFQSLAALDYTIEEIDYVMSGPVGRPMGFFQLGDLVGNDLFPPIAKVIYDGCPDDPYRKYFVMPDFIYKMVDKKLLGAKTNGLGFYKTENRKPVAVYDIKKEDYRELNIPKFESVETALKEKDVIKRIHAILYPQKPDKGSEMARRFLGLLMKYADELTGIIGETHDIEIGMTYGLNHRVGPIGLLKSEYSDDFRNIFAK